MFLEDVLPPLTPGDLWVLKKPLTLYRVVLSEDLLELVPLSGSHARFVDQYIPYARPEEWAYLRYWVQVGTSRFHLLPREGDVYLAEWSNGNRVAPSHLLFATRGSPGTVFLWSDSPIPSDVNQELVVFTLIQAGPQPEQMTVYEHVAESS